MLEKAPDKSTISRLKPAPHIGHDRHSRLTFINMTVDVSDFSEGSSGFLAAAL
jgi:hypothetical protein